MLALCECLDRFCNIASRRHTSLGPPGAADGRFRRPVRKCWVNEMDYAHPRAEHRCHYANISPHYRRPIALWLWQLPLGDRLGGVSHKASQAEPVRLFRQPHRSCHPVTELIGNLLYRDCCIVFIYHLLLDSHRPHGSGGRWILPACLAWGSSRRRSLTYTATCSPNHFGQLLRPIDCILFSRLELRSRVPR